MDVQRLGAFIQICRKDLGMTQSELGAKLNVTDKAISRWERGVGFPDIKLLEPLADALQISIEELMQCQRLQTEVGPEPQKKPWYYQHRRLLAVICILIYGVYYWLSSNPQYADRLVCMIPLNRFLFFLTLVACLYASYREVSDATA